MTAIGDGKALRSSEKPMTPQKQSVVEPIEYREDDKDWEVREQLSCSNTNFGGEDPAIDHPEPEPAMAPAWMEGEL